MGIQQETIIKNKRKQKSPIDISVERYKGLSTIDGMLVRWRCRVCGWDEHTDSTWLIKKCGNCKASGLSHLGIFVPDGKLYVYDEVRIFKQG